MAIDRNFKFVALFSFIYFLLCYAFSIHWYQNGYFSVDDIFFDTDLNARLTTFSIGGSIHGLIHVLLSLFVIPISIVEALFSNFITNKVELRELIALSICPLFSSITLIFIYKTLRILKLTVFDANIFTLLFAMSFSNIIFAIIPETYAISCFLITYLIYYFLKNELTDYSSKACVWFFIAVLLTGITITNLCVFFLVFMLHLSKNGSLFYAVKKAIIYSALTLVVVIIFFNINNLIYVFISDSSQAAKWQTNWIVDSFWGVKLNLINLFSASFNSFIGLFPHTSINEHCINVTCHKLSFIRYQSDYLFLSSLAIIVGAVFYLSKKFILNKQWKSLYLVCLLIIGFNFCLHTFYGKEMFLYTQHWITPLLLLLVPILQNKRLISISLLLMLAVVNVNFLLNVEQLVVLK